MDHVKSLLRLKLHGLRSSKGLSTQFNESPADPEHRRARSAEQIQMQSASRFRQNFGVHYDEFELGRQLSQFKESSARLNTQFFELYQSNDEIPCVVQDLNKLEDLRGKLVHHVLKSQHYRYLKDRGITILDPVAQINLHKKHQRSEERLKILKQDISRDIEQLETHPQASASNATALCHN